MSLIENYYEKFLSIEDFLPDSQKNLNQFLCILCGGVLYNPLLDSCGHLYCKKCIYQSLESSNTCPISRNKIDIKLLQTQDVIESNLNAEIVYCKHKDIGCKFTGMLKNLEDHLTSTCRKQVISCENSDCGISLLREDMVRHLKICDYRQVNCPLCFKVVKYNRKAYHIEECQKFKLECPLNCGKVIEREMMDIHCSFDCDNLEVDCPYVEMGCKIKTLKKNVGDHLNLLKDEHNVIFINFVKDFNLQLQKQLTIINLSHGRLNERINRINSRLKNGIVDVSEVEIGRDIGTPNEEPNSNETHSVHSLHSVHSIHSLHSVHSELNNNLNINCVSSESSSVIKPRSKRERSRENSIIEFSEATSNHDYLNYEKKERKSKLKYFN